MNRRQYLATTALGVSTLVAGCTSGGDSDTATTAPPTERPATQTPQTDAPTTTQPTTTRDVSELKDNAVELEYEEFFRNFEKYADDETPVYYPYGGIYQTLYDQYSEGVDHLQLQVSTSNDAWQGDIAARWDGDERFLENDIVELWGIPVDLYEYTTVNDDVRTIPRIEMVDATLLEEDE